MLVNGFLKADLNLNIHQTDLPRRRSHTNNQAETVFKLFRDFFAADQLTERTGLQPLNGMWQDVLPPVSVAPSEP